MPTDKDILGKYLPEAAVPVIHEWLKNSNMQLKITRARNSKLGDYRPPVKYSYHRISVNHNLNKYHFLITLVHEYAHLKVWNIHKNNVKPHGDEWKSCFSELMEPFLNTTIFPDELLPVVRRYFKNPAASSTNAVLLTALRKYDVNKVETTVADIPVNGLFRTQNGMIFRKGEKQRTRYKCIRLDNKRHYLVSALAEVKPVAL